MTLCTIGTLLSVFSFDTAAWSSGSNGYTMNMDVHIAKADMSIPVVVQGTGVRVAMVINTPENSNKMRQAYNDSFVKIRFQQHFISWPNGKYNKTETALNSAACDIPAASELTGSVSWRLEKGTPAICPTEPAVLGGKFHQGLDYRYLVSSVEVCQSYCGQSGEISCAKCAPQAELQAFLSQEIAISFYFQEIVNIVTNQQTWVELGQTFHLQMGLTPNVEVFLGAVHALIRDKTTYGINDDDTVQRTYARWSGASTLRNMPFTSDKALARWYMRVDPNIETEETHTPYTLLECITGLGGLASATAIIFGTIGTGANCLMNDDDAVHAASDAYIASVAWGDVEATAAFGRELRQAQLPSQKFCRSAWWKVYERKKRQYNELQHFRRVMLELIDDPKYAHLDPRDKLQTDTVSEFEEKQHLRHTTGGMGSMGIDLNPEEEGPVKEI